MKDTSLRLALALALLLFSASSALAFNTFYSAQEGTTPVKGSVLETDGTNSTWAATSTLGITGGSATPGGSSGQVEYNASSAFGGTSTTTLAAGSNVSFSGGTPVILGSSPITISATGGGGTGGLASTTPWTPGQLAVVSSNSALYGLSTSTLAASSPLTGSFTQLGSGGTLGCQTASASQAGCLSSTDWSTFNGKVSTGRQVLTTYPLQGGGDLSADRTLSLAFGTTTSNTWAGTQTFTNAPIFSSLTGILKGAGSSAITMAIGDIDYQKPITLTTTGSSGAATFSGDVLNIPQYTGGGPGTNYWTNSGSQTYLNIGTNAAAPFFIATNTTATSSFPIASTTYLLVTADGNASPVYGTNFSTDQIDAGGNANQLRSIDSYNNMSGTCAQSGFVANGDIPTLSQDFTTLANTNSNWTGGASCADFTDPSNVTPLSTYLFQPTGSIYNVLGTTTNTFMGSPVGFKWLTNSGATQAAVLTNQGNFGIATSSPFSTLSVAGNGFFNGNLTGANITATGTLSVGKSGTVGTTTIISDLAVGLTGTTNPAFQVLGNITSAATGLSVIPAAAGSGVTLQTTSSGTNEALNIKSKGTGVITLGYYSSANSQTNVDAASTIEQAVGGVANTILTGSSLSVTLGASNTASTQRYLFGNGADTALTASTEAPWVVFNQANTRTHATGAIGVQRDIRIVPATHNFATGTVANNTIASVTPFEIDGPDTAGSLANFANDYAAFIGQGTALNSSTTNAYGLAVQAPSGATNNYAAEFLNGNVGIGTTSPGSILAIQGVANFVASAASTIYNDFRIIGNLFLPSLATPAGAFLAVDPTGKVIATTTPSSASGPSHYSATSSTDAIIQVPVVAGNYVQVWFNANGSACTATINNASFNMYQSSWGATTTLATPGYHFNSGSTPPQCGVSYVYSQVATTTETWNFEATTGSFSTYTVMAQKFSS